MCSDRMMGISRNPFSPPEVTELYSHSHSRHVWACYKYLINTFGRCLSTWTCSSYRCIDRVRSYSSPSYTRGIHSFYLLIIKVVRHLWLPDGMRLGTDWKHLASLKNSWTEFMIDLVWSHLVSFAVELIGCSWVESVYDWVVSVIVKIPSFVRNVSQLVPSAPYHIFVGLSFQRVFHSFCSIFYKNRRTQRWGQICSYICSFHTPILPLIAASLLGLATAVIIKV